jgi:hypothetical protein
MAVATDIFSVNIITEFAGVQMSNKTYWEIDDIGDDPAVDDALSDLLIAYHAAIEPRVSTLWKVVCGIWENISNPEGKHVVFTNLPGTAVNTGHPQFQVFRVNRYAQNLAADAIKRGAFNQSGVEEEQSTRGRVDSPAGFAALVQFLTVTSVLGGTGWVIQPHLRWAIVPGPPATYEYAPIRHSQMSTQVHTLRSRKTVLCAAG